MVWLYLQAPYLGLHLSAGPSAQAGLTIAAVNSNHLNHERVAPGSTLGSLVGNGIMPVELTADDLVEEPATLIQPGALSEFLHRQSRLARILRADQVTSVVNGNPQPLRVTSRAVWDIPAAFWLQCLAGWLCLIIGTAVLVFQREASSASRYFFTAGIAIYIAAEGGAVYATRELALNDLTWDLVLFINHLGTVLIVACLTGLIWNYPYRLANRRLLGAVFAAAGLALWAEQADIGGIGAWLLYLYCSLGFFLGVLLAIFQWRRTANDPVNRAAMRWFLLAMVAGVVTPSSLIVVPALFGAGLGATHTVIFVSLLLMYIGVALGISRYRLFDLDVWWFRAWGWFLGGVSILLVDILLIRLFDLGNPTALTLAVASVGWLYFPVRQWLLRRFLRSGARPLELAMNELVGALSGARDVAAVQARWPAILRSAFVALEVRECQPTPARVEFGGHGTVLLLPALNQAPGEPGLEVMYPNGGSRLFNREDLRVAELLLGLMRRATGEVRAREEGAEAERARIRRDMHDDLGARLLDMTHELPDETGRQMARQATGQLRSILSAMGETATPLSDAMEALRTECETRLAAAGIETDWRTEVDGERQLAARQRANLGSILREATNNIIRHAGATTATYRIQLQDSDCLRVTVTDDGKGLPPDAMADSGLGLVGMHRRAAELGGRLRLDSPPQGGTRLQLELSLDAD